ncbi:MAG: hypothetical protein ACFFB3_08095 [Candidatus Hodarchaeota archaeon]
MSQNTIFKLSNGEIQDLIPSKDQLTFLVGAEISTGSPNNINFAIGIFQALLEYCVPSEEVERLMGLDALRYEIVVERVQGSYEAEFQSLRFQ